MSDETPLTLPEVRDSLKTVLDTFGPQQMTDGTHAHLSWLLGLVEECVSDDEADTDD